MCSNLTWEQDRIRESTWVLILGLIQGVPLWPDSGHNAECLWEQCNRMCLGILLLQQGFTEIYFLNVSSSVFFFFLFRDDSRGMGKRVMHCPFLCTVQCECSPTHHDSAVACCLTKHPKTFSAPWSACTNWRLILTGLQKNICLVYSTCNYYNVASNYYFLHVQTFRTFYNNLWGSTAQSAAEVVMEQTGS